MNKELMDPLFRHHLLPSAANPKVHKVNVYKDLNPCVRGLQAPSLASSSALVRKPLVVSKISSVCSNCIPLIVPLFHFPPLTQFLMERSLNFHFFCHAPIIFLLLCSSPVLCCRLFKLKNEAWRGERPHFPTTPPAVSPPR